MSDYQNASQTIRRLAVQLQGMVDAADILDAIGAPAQHLAELNAQIDAANATLTDTIGAKLREAQHTEDTAKRDAEKTTSDAQVAADSIVSDANLAARQLLSDAQAQADAYKASCFADIERQAEEFNARAVKIKADTDALQTQYDSLAPQVASMTVEFDRLTGVIAQARAKMAEIMGAAQ